MMVDTDDIVTTGRIAQLGGLPANQVRTWVSRNNYGLADLMLPIEGQTLFLWSQVSPIVDRAKRRQAEMRAKRAEFGDVG